MRGRRSPPSLLLLLLLLSLVVRCAGAAVETKEVVEEEKANVTSTGLVVVDVRDEQTISSFILPWIMNRRAVSPTLPIILFTSTNTHVPRSVSKALADAPSPSGIKYLPRQWNGVVLDGYIGKAYALLSSEFTLTVLTDTDSWACPGWETHFRDPHHYIADKELDEEEPREITKETQERRIPSKQLGADIVWSLAPRARQRLTKTGEAPHYGLLDGFKHASATSFSPSEAAEFSSVLERNTGTVIAVRRNARTQSFLKDVIRIHGILRQRGILRRGKGSSHARHDQPAFREAFYIHGQDNIHGTRGNLTERLLPTTLACRAGVRTMVASASSLSPPGVRLRKDGVDDHHQPLGEHARCICPCSCTSCAFIHTKSIFKRCAQKATAAADKKGQVATTTTTTTAVAASTDRRYATRMLLLSSSIMLLLFFLFQRSVVTGEGQKKISYFALREK